LAKTHDSLGGTHYQSSDLCWKEKEEKEEDGDEEGGGGEEEEEGGGGEGEEEEEEDEEEEEEVRNFDHVFTNGTQVAHTGSTHR
jgi:hypothetical protein